MPIPDSSAFAADHEGRFGKACALALAAPQWGGVIDTSPYELRGARESPRTPSATLHTTEAPKAADRDDLAEDRVRIACTLRSAHPEDDTFLFHLACTNHGFPDDAAPEQAFASELQRTRFQQQRARAAVSIIEAEGVRVGSLWIDLEASHVAITGLHVRRGWESFGIQPACAELAASSAPASEASALTAPLCNWRASSRTSGWPRRTRSPGLTRTWRTGERMRLDTIATVRARTVPPAS